MAANNTDGWKKIAIEQIKKNRKVTAYRGLDTSEVPYKDSSNYKVFENSPNLELDQGQTYLISGTESQIMLQSSLIKALHDILGNRLGYSINFDEWFEDFELEFKIDPRTGRSRIPVRTEAEILKFTYWGGSKDERPKFEYLDIPDERRRTKEDEKLLWYRVIRFWKNRNLINDFYVLAGTPTELREQIFYLMNGGGTPEASGSANIMTGGGVVKRKGRPQIVLWFKELREDVEPGFEAVYGRVTFRLMDKTDDPVVTGQQITWADLENYAQKIKTLFPSGYRWRKGKEQVVYHNWEQGYQLQLLCRSKTDGIELIQKILQIQDHVYDPRWCKHSVPENPAQAYPTMPEQITVLGQQVRRDRLRPIADVVFHHADLLLANWKKPIILVDPDGKLVPNRP